MPRRLLSHGVIGQLHRCWIGRSRHGRGLDNKGAVALVFATAVLPLSVAMAAAIDLSRIADARAALQGAVDTAALSGAAAYAADSAAFNARSITTATSAFCSATAKLPSGAAMVAQNNGQTCGSTAGPVVTAVTDSFVVGKPGITHGAGVSCTGTYLPAAPYKCGFIVTVSANATMTPMLPFIYGASKTIAVSAMAANPFLNFAEVFSLPNGIGTGAKYANSVWAYPLALNSMGSIDYSSNSGGLPDTSACNGDPDQVACGSYVMLASAMYSNSGTGYTPPGQNVIYDNGVVRNPVSPTLVTATTPLGIAFRSIAGGNYVQQSPPGVYGYQVTNLGSNPPQYAYAPNGCIYPYNALAYNTVGQVWTTKTTTKNGTTTTSYTPTLPWSLVTHWFYSSYLAKNLPPSQGEILAQTTNNEDIPSVPNDPAQSGGNINGKSTYNANPSPAVATSCPSTTTTNGVTKSNDKLQTTTYATTGNTNCSLYVSMSTSPGYTQPNSGYTGSCFNPASTPGQQYTVMNCQQYGSAYYTFYWNDMGGAVSDNYNYGDGSVTLSCTGTNHIVLIG